jgi:hypothetical protein
VHKSLTELCGWDNIFLNLEWVKLELILLSFELCSVGGTDYGSVRVGTYMGRKMIKCAASNLLSELLLSCTSTQPGDSSPDEYEGHGVDLLKSEASMEYLCNLPPHRSDSPYGNWHGIS